MSLLVEDLRSRWVVRVGIAYVLTALGLVMSLGVVSAWLGLPRWAVRLVAGAAYVVMPFVLVLTWALEDRGPESARVPRRR